MAVDLDPERLVTGLVPGLAGATRSGDRAAVRDYLEDKLGPDESALAIIIKDADWDAVIKGMEPHGGDHLISELGRNTFWPTVSTSAMSVPKQWKSTTTQRSKWARGAEVSD